MKPTDDVDKLLADTLGGVIPQKRKEVPAAPPAPPPAAAAAPPPAPKAKTDYDKALQDIGRGSGPVSATIERILITTAVVVFSAP